MPRALGGDVFAGLFTVGVKDAGFDVVGHVEHCDYGTKTAKLNFPDLDIKIGVENWKPYPKKIDFMYTNPPCAPWSSLSYSHKAAGQNKWKDDPRIHWVDDLVTAALEMEVKTWCWESVVNAWNHGREFVLEKANRFYDAGYSITVLLQNNKYLGAPQNRKRMFLIAHQYPLVWPAFTEPKTLGETLKGVVTPKELLPFAQRPMKPWDIRLWKLSKDTGGYLRKARNLVPADQVYGQKHSFMSRRTPINEVPGIVTEHRLHPTEPRMFSFPEMKALDGLPQSWQTTETRHVEVAHELQRCVLPPVGKWLATAVRDGLKKRPLAPPTAMLVDFREPENQIVEPIDLDIRAHRPRAVAPNQKEEDEEMGSSGWGTIAPGTTVSGGKTTRKEPTPTPVKSEPEPPKRGRGRPRKSETTTTTGPLPPPATGPTPPKRGRGRPQHEYPPLPAEIARIENLDVPPKKRGRPSKTQPVVETTETSPSSKSLPELFKLLQEQTFDRPGALATINEIKQRMIARLTGVIVVPTPAEAPVKPAKAPRQPKAPEVPTATMKRTAPPKGEFKTSKAYIVARVEKDGYGPNSKPPKEWAELVAAEVRALFPGRTTGASDVYWVWRRMAG